MSTFIYVLLALLIIGIPAYKFRPKKVEKTVEKPVEEYTPVTMAGDYDGDPIEKDLIITEGQSATTTVNIKKEEKKDKSTAVFQRVNIYDNKKQDNRLITPTTKTKNKNNGNVYNEAITEVATEIPTIIQMHYGLDNNHHQESKVIIEDVETKRPITVENDAPKWEANDTSYKQPSHTPSYRSSHNHHDSSNDYNSGSSHRSSYNHDSDTSKWTPSSGGSHDSGGSISDAVSGFFD